MLSIYWRRVSRGLAVSVLVTALSARLVAETHLVSPADLQKQAVATTAVRQHNVQTVKQFLSSPTAEKAIKSAQMDPVKVKAAVATLNDEELTRLAARAEKAQVDFAAGTLTERDLTIIILGIAVLILIIVAVR